MQALVAITLLGQTVALGSGGALLPMDEVELREVGQVALHGKIAGLADISAVEVRGEWMLLGTDEVRDVQLLRRSGDRAWSLRRKLELCDGPKGTEVDIEGICLGGGKAWVLGSHSLKRKERDAKRSHAENDQRLRQVVHEKTRDGLFSFELDEFGGAGPVSRIDLRAILTADPVLGPFTAIPSKENGVDFEGLAFHDDRLWLGMRGPVLRDNLAVVVILDPKAPQDYELRFLDLKGFGIRSLARVSDGFVGIAGPMGDRKEEHVLFHWTGASGLMGKAGADVRRVLCELPSPKGGRAEGLCVLEDDGETLRLLIVHDGVPGGRAREYELRR